MLVAERMDDFEHEDATMLKIKNLSGDNWPQAGTAEESVRLQEITTLFLEMVMMKAMVYHRVGDGGSSSSTTRSQQPGHRSEEKSRSI